MEEEIFIVFQWRNGVAEFQGAFTTKEKAVRACRNENYCVCPANLDEEIEEESVVWPGAEWPGAFYPVSGDG